ncbi:MAG: hemerythrin [Deferribacteres bacterium]|jgi:hemerythrin|nr:hemerythrin [Deferribacteres bacterium]
MSEENLLRIELFTETYETICKKVESISENEIDKLNYLEIKSLTNELKIFHKFFWNLMETYNFPDKETYRTLIDNTFLPFLNNTIFLKNLTLGIKLLDAQNRSLFVYIDKFISKVIENSTKDDVEKVIQYLEKYADKHFHDEETIMKNSGYSEAESHIAEHKKFKNTIAHIKSQINGNNSELIEQIFKGLNEWLIKHILGSDKSFAAFYHEKSKN